MRCSYQFQNSNDFHNAFPISAVIERKVTSSFETVHNISIRAVRENSRYQESYVEIVGYGFPKLSFESHLMTLVNKQNISSEDRNTLGEKNLYQYILDPEKMTPMQGIP